MASGEPWKKNRRGTGIPLFYCLLSTADSLLPLPTATAATPTAARPPRRASAGALDGGFQERHAGDAVGDARVFEGRGSRLAAAAADGPFERAMKVGESLVKSLGMARRGAANRA